MDGEETVRCPSCGASGVPGGETIMPVWEDPDDHQSGREPDWHACLDCHTMHAVEPPEAP